MKKKILTLSLLSLLVSLTVNANELHVGSGQTYLTVQEAVDNASSGDVVVIHAGTYREEVEIDVNGLTIKPNGSDRVIMNGCEPLLNWVHEGNDVYSTTMNWDVTESIQTNQVFVDCVMMHEARWPKQPVNSSFVLNPGQGQLERIDTIDPGTRNRNLIDDDIANESDARWEGALIFVNLSNPYNMKDGQGWTGTVHSKSGANINVRTTGDSVGIKFTGNKNWGVDKGTYYYLFHPRSSSVAASGGVTELLAKGEWWKNGNTLYVKTPDKKAPASGLSGRNLIEAKKYPFAFRPKASKGVLKNVTIKDIKLFGTSITTDNDYDYYKKDNTKDPQTRNPKSSFNAENVIIDGIDARYVYHTFDCFGDWQYMFNGRSGIILSGTNCELKNSSVRYSAASAISISGKKNKVDHNIIYDINYLVGECGAINNGGKDWASEDHEISYNTIYNTTHAAISLRTLKNSDANHKGVARIHHNHIYNALTRAWDAGCLDEAGEYGNWVRIDHNLIVGNEIHNGTSNKIQYGIYLDWGSSKYDYEARYIIDHNVVHLFYFPIGINHANNTRIFNNTAYIKDYWADVQGAYKLNNGTNAQNNAGLVTLSSDEGKSIKNHNYDVMGRRKDSYFTDWQSADYTLTSSASNLIDQGTTTDWDDPISGFAPDIGAYEYGKPKWEVGAKVTLENDK